MNECDYLTLDDFRAMSNAEFDRLFPAARAIEIDLLRAGMTQTVEQPASEPLPDAS